MKGASSAAADVTMDVDDDDDDDGREGTVRTVVVIVLVHGHARTTYPSSSYSSERAPCPTDGINKAFRAERPAGPPHRCAALLTRQIDRPPAPALPVPCPHAAAPSTVLVVVRSPLILIN
jgi:hypothetical protein